MACPDLAGFCPDIIFGYLIPEALQQDVDALKEILITQHDGRNHDPDTARRICTRGFTLGFRLLAFGGHLVTFFK